MTDRRDRSDLKKHIRARQKKTGESYTTARMHVLRARDGGNDQKTDKPERITGVVLKCNDTSLRVRVQGEEGTLTLRCAGNRAFVNVVPAQFIEATVNRRWLWRGDPYASGKIERVWTDIPALKLEPLPIKKQGVVDIARVYEPVLPPDPYAEMWAFFAATPRHSWLFDGIAWGVGVGLDPDDQRGSLVCEASEYVDPQVKRKLLMDALFADLRCIDAHVHLANMEFDHSPEQAMVGYEIAIAIGELSLPEGFTDMLSWHIYNRPFLRALSGYGLCLWRLGKLDEAQSVFERMLSLNPNDNQGARFCWNDIRRGLPWRPDDVGEEYLYEGEPAH